VAETEPVYERGGDFSGVAAARSGVPPVFAGVSEVRPYRLMQGIVARAVHGEHVTVSVVDLEANVSMPEHRHVNEQVGVVVRGELDFTIGGETRQRRAGDMWVIPPGVPHHVVVGPEGCTVVESFAPPRADWEGLERLEPGAGAWPG
jgi:quercetin dioxygenase-like cupin family protein